VILRHADKEALMRAVMHERIETWSVRSRQRIVARGDTLDEHLRHYALDVAMELRTRRSGPLPT
jgi:hypothetical protein